MRMKANVYKQYGDAAIMNIVLESLPKVRKRESNSVSERKLTIFLPGRSLPRWPLRWPKPMRLC